MPEIVITSSLLILIIIALRFLLRGKLSPTIIYALWAVAALRLLVPVSFFDSRASVMNLFDKPESVTLTEAHNTPPAEAPGTIFNETETDSNSSDIVQDAPTDTETNTSNTSASKASPSASAIALVVWLAGMAAVLAYTLSANIHFSRLLRSTRRPLKAIRAPLPVYETDHITSPCVFGLLRPAIYLTPYAADNQRRAGYVITHELMHWRHLDHIWAAVRAICCAVYWFNPLVWLAAYLSRQDSELACDSAVIKAVGSQYRIDYGRTLVDMVIVGVTPSDLVLTSTTMSSAGRSTKERITMIKNNPKTLVWAAITAMIVILAAFIITFTGARSAVPGADIDPAVSGGDISGTDILAPEEYPDRLAGYSTYFNAANVGRYNNIRISAQYIDGTVLQPGEEFSFNGIVGERTEERGFVHATGYAFEGTDEDYGAGISQTATTLFNAAFMCGLEITEQHPHLYTVNYTTKSDGTQSYGNDAAVAWGINDLGFVNSRAHPVIIRMTCSDTMLTAEIHGTDDGIRAEFGFSENETVPYGTIYMPPAVDTVNQSGQTGRTIGVYRVVYENGSEISREQAYTAVYMPLMETVYTDELPQGREYHETYYNDFGSNEADSTSIFPIGVSSRTIWSNSEVAYLLGDTPEFTGGECVSSAHYIEGTVYHQVLADYTAKTGILELSFSNIQPGYLQEYVDLLRQYGFTYFADDYDPDGSMYIVYNAPSHGIGVQIQRYSPGDDPRHITISFFRQGEGCFGLMEPVPKG